MNVLQDIRDSTRFVLESQSHVKIDSSCLSTAIEEIVASVKAVGPSQVEWDNEKVHFRDLSKPELTIQYLLVLDSLNFCFWPTDGLEYDFLASSLKVALEKDPQVFSAESLAKVTPDIVTNVWFGGRQLPLLEERCRLLREIGIVLGERFSGLALNLVAAADKSAARLVRLVTESFPGFRDSCVYRGRQVFLYKRAQIFVGDVWGAFSGKSFGEFHDIDSLTMFADYRVPQILRAWGVFVYSDELAARVDRLEQIIAGTEEEIAIRAATVQVVEQLREVLESSHGIHMKSIEVDWLLWQKGEAVRNEIKPHHRTLTIFY